MRSIDVDGRHGWADPEEDPVSLLSDLDRRRARARRVLGLLHDLWGDELPPGAEPHLTVVLDALAGDDDLGARNGYVVQGDGLTYAALETLVRLSGAPSGAPRALPRDVLPREVLDRLFSATGARDRVAPVREEPPAPLTIDLTAEVTAEVTAERPSGVPAEAGTWLMNADSGVLSWDSASAEVLRRVNSPLSITVTEELARWVHPDDRHAVAQGFDRCLRTARPHEVEFRALATSGAWVTCLASGRRVVDVEGRASIVGLLRPVGDR